MNVKQSAEITLRKFDLVLVDSREGIAEAIPYEPKAVLEILKILLSKLDSTQRNEFLALLPADPDTEPTAYNSTRETLLTQTDNQNELSVREQLICVYHAIDRLGIPPERFLTRRAKELIKSV